MFVALAAADGASTGDSPPIHLLSLLSPAAQAEASVEAGPVSVSGKVVVAHAAQFLGEVLAKSLLLELYFSLGPSLEPIGIHHHRQVGSQLDESGVAVPDEFEEHYLALESVSDHNVEAVLNQHQEQREG